MKLQALILFEITNSFLNCQNIRCIDSNCTNVKILKLSSKYQMTHYSESNNGRAAICKFPTKLKKKHPFLNC